MTAGELIGYETDDGRSRIQLRAADGTVWLAQTDLAELFATSKQNVSLHLKNIFGDQELHADSVVKESLTTTADGNCRGILGSSNHADALAVSMTMWPRLNFMSEGWIDG